MKRQRVKSSPAQCLERAGDRYMASQEPRRALAKYRAAQSLAPDAPQVYRKLIAAHQAATTEWGPQDVAESLAWEMRRQELEHPPIRDLHERLSPEWQEVTTLLHRLVVVEDATIVARLREEIIGYGAKAVRPLLDLLLLLKGKPGGTS